MCRGHSASISVLQSLLNPMLSCMMIQMARNAHLLDLLRPELLSSMIGDHDLE